MTDHAIVDRARLEGVIRDAIIRSYSIPRKGGNIYTDRGLALDHQARVIADAVEKEYARQ